MVDVRDSGQFISTNDARLQEKGRYIGAFYALQIRCKV